MAEFKKVVIPESSLPATNAKTEQYVVRYRVISEDRNRISPWSGQYVLDVSPTETLESNVVDVIGTSIIVSWIAEESAGTAYEVYASWGFDNNTSVGQVYPISDPNVTELDINKYYYKKTSDNSITFPIPSNFEGTVAKAVQVFIQKESYPKGQISPKRLIAQSAVISLT